MRKRTTLAILAAFSTIFAVSVKSAESEVVQYYEMNQAETKQFIEMNLESLPAELWLKEKLFVARPMHDVPELVDFCFINDAGDSFDCISVYNEETNRKLDLFIGKDWKTMEVE